MGTRAVDTTSLKTFLTIADTGSFSLAAEHLYLTQPAISKRLHSLEQELGARLFDRVGRQTLLTPAGEVFYQRARSILQQLEDSRREIDNLSGKVAGTLHIGTSHHIGLHRLPPLLKQLHQQYPDLNLDIHFQDSEAVYHDVQTGKLELGVITIPASPDPELHTVTIWPDPLEFVVARNHPLVSAGSSSQRISAKLLSQYGAILPAKNTYTRQILERAFTKLGHEITTSLSTNYLETNKMLVSVGLGWSLLPRTMVGSDLRVLSIPRLQLQRSLGVVHHPKRTLSNAAKIVLDLLNQARQSPVGDRH
ncbi:MAG: LysR family transcriptional regulator [Gammaproteobacteria bacterium]|jgi:DNA-binding transcriptional LysR family regulator